MVAWAVVLATAAGLGAVAGGDVDNNLALPGTESQRAFDVLDRRFPELGGDTAVIAYRAEAGATDPEVRARMERLFGRVGGLDHVVAVASPYDAPPVGGAGAVSRDGRIAFAVVQFDVRATEVPKPVIFTMKDHVEEAAAPGLQVELGGEAVRFAETEGPGEREGVGLAAAVVILLIAFGSVVAMGLPIVTAVFGIGVSLALVSLLANVMNVNTFAPQVASMIGLGVGIDYALFIVTRFREGLDDGLDVDDAVAAAATTSGRAVVFAGLTVVISLMAMFLSGMPFIYGFGAAPAIAVLVMVLVAVTLLPALLGVIGRRVDSLRVPLLSRAGEAGEARTAHRWSRIVQRRPWLAAGVALALLLALASPLLSMRLGWAGSGSNPDTRTTRRAYDLLTEGFGPGSNEPLLLVAELPGPGRLDALQPLLDALPRVDGVAMVTPPRPNGAGDVAVVTVFPASAPHDEDAGRLIHDLRREVIPAMTGPTGAEVTVAGLAPLFVDMSDVLGARLPWILAGVLALSFLLLMAVFRSLLVPLKAVVMNLLSIGAAYGVVVAVFQWGWLKPLAGIDRVGPVESFVPLILFAILFGLSMDYEVFLLSRMREGFLRHGDNSEAVADGLASTARVITAAAAIMVALFFSFVLGEERIIKVIGLGLAVAVLVDATLVRMLLVPATMELLGRANWWLPGWLSAALPEIAVEGAAPGPARAPAPAAAGPAPPASAPDPVRGARPWADASGTAAAPEPAARRPGSVVLAGRTRFHRPDCHHAGEGPSLSRAAAARKGLEACRVCQP